MTDAYIDVLVTVESFRHFDTYTDFLFSTDLPKVIYDFLGLLIELHWLVICFISNYVLCISV